MLGALLLTFSACPPAAPTELPLPEQPVESGFVLDRDAFAFSNFGGSNNSSAMTPALTARLFGAEAVCMADEAADGGTTGGCRPKPIAREWIKKVNEAMKGGRCEGFAVLSNLMFLGELTPQQFGAQNARELALSNNVSLNQELAYWFSTQYVSTIIGRSTVTLGAREAVAFFADEFANNRGEMYRIGMVRLDAAGRMAGGHAMVATGVAPGPKAGTFLIHVYDNNHPNDARAILVDADADRWEYQASSNPDRAESLYMGDAENKNRLFITSVKPRLGVHPCTFCKGDDLAETQTNQVFSLGLEVSATDDEGHTAGLVDGRIVNDIEGAFVTPSFTVDPWDDDAPVNMVVPLKPGGTRLTLAGRGGAPAQVSLFGPGSVTGVTGVIPPGAADTLTLVEGGAGMRYAPSSGSAPQLFLARQTLQGTQTMVQIQLPEGASLSGVSMDVDEATGDVSMAASSDGGVELEVSITRATSDGEDSFVGVIEAPAGGNIDFAVEAWEGEGTAIGAAVDVDGDGTADETVEVVSTGPAGEAPAAPTGLVASAVGHEAVTLTWVDGSASEERFEVERDVMGGGSFVPFLTLPPNGTTATDSPLRHSSSYRYRVRAVNRYGASAWSNEADVTLPGCPAGTQDDDADGSCLADCATSGLSCGFGACSTSSGTAACVCDAGYAGADCGACAAGFQDHDGNGTCLPTCATAALACSGHGTCDDTSGTAVCVCAPGYAGTGTLACTDVDECATGNGGCDALTTCTNTDGGRTCGACPSGYAGTGATSCVDVDECQMTNGSCDPLTTCTNVPGSRVCGACPAGYTGSGDMLCVDVDECAVGNGGCDALAGCFNTPGGRTCGACPSGYSGSGETSCTDIDECASANGGCDALSTCTNTPGGRTCGACPSGYSGTGETGCTDVDECQMTNGSCDPLTTCTNLPGSRSCGACPAGYTGSGDTLCVDIDECATGTDDCDANATCTDTAGSFTCACNSGYLGDGRTCAPITGCDTNRGGCDTNATCTGTGPSTNTCTCNGGFVGNGLSCAPPAAAVSFTYAARQVGANVGTVTLDVMRSLSHQGNATVPYTVSGSCVGSNVDGSVLFNVHEKWKTVSVTIDPSCVPGDALVVTLGQPTSSGLAPALGAISMQTLTVVASNACTTNFAQVVVDSAEDLDADGVPDRCDTSLAPAGKASRYVPAVSATASTAYGASVFQPGNVLARNFGESPSPTPTIFAHDFHAPYTNGAWLSSDAVLTQWLTVALAAPARVDEFSLVNFAHHSRNEEWMRGIKSFRLYGSNTAAAAPSTRSSKDPSMQWLGTYTAQSYNDRSWWIAGRVAGLPQVFRVTTPGEYRYYHLEVLTSQRPDWTEQFPGDLSGVRRLELSRYDDDVCVVNNGGCHADATCTDVQGVAQCVCRVGFYGDGQACTALAQDPRSVAAPLKAWVAADVGVELNGSTVARWRDLSGNGHHFVQATASRQPVVNATALNGRPALQFTAADAQVLQTGVNVPAPASVCYVARVSGPTVGRVVAAENNWLLGYYGGVQGRAHFDGWVRTDGIAATSNIVTFCGVMTGSLSSIYENGVLLGSNSGGLTGPDRLTVGGWVNSEFSDVQVGEVLVYGGALGTADLAAVHAYLMNKYPTCTDGLKNGSELDIDCGGTCGACADNRRCLVDTDCVGGVCDSESMTCGAPGVRTYDEPGTEFSLVVPAGRTVNLQVWGAGGQNGGYTSLGGGGGGFTRGQLVGAGQVLRVRVGRGATSSVLGPFFGGGGRGAGCGPSGGGGGRSEVMLADGTVVLVAGGGGGAGPGQGAFGGAGCGVSGGGTGGASGGQGGTSSTGFAQWLGADGDDFGAAGGGGWFGGHKGSGPGCNLGGGGGGGSCYVAPFVIGGLELAGSGTTPGGASLSSRGSAGRGGVASNEAGANGRVVISWSTGVSCATANGGCDVNATCTESGQGTVSCTCNSGYGGDGSTCVDISAPPSAGLRMWVNAEAGLVMNGASVSGWLDQSGHGNHFVQNNPSQQPLVDAFGIGARPALAFTADSGHSMTMATNLPAPVTVCYVARMAGPRRGRILSGAFNNWLLGWHGGFEDRAYFEGWVSGGAPSTDANPLLYCSVQTGSLSTVYRNGALVASNAGGVTGPNGLTFESYGEFSDSRVAEIVVYGSALGDAARAQVELYLKARYGL